MHRQTHARRLVVAWLAVLVVGTAMVLQPTPVSASTISRYSTGYSGTYLRDHWWWVGVVRAGETAYMTASGSAATGDGSGMRVGWLCGNTLFGKDWLGSRVWIVAPGASGSATLFPADQDRNCGFLAEVNNRNSAGQMFTVDRSEVRLDHDSGYVQPPMLTPPSAGPTATPTPAPTPIVPFVTPIPTASPSAGVCFASAAPSAGGAAVVAPCPSPTPSPTATPRQYWHCDFYDGSMTTPSGWDGARLCVDNNEGGVTVPVGGTLVVTYTVVATGLDGNAPGRRPRMKVCEADVSGVSQADCREIRAATTGSVAGTLGTPLSRLTGGLSLGVCWSGSQNCTGAYRFDAGDMLNDVVPRTYNGFFCGEVDFYYSTKCDATPHVYNSAGVEVGFDGLASAPPATASPTATSGPGGSSAPTCYATATGPSGVITIPVPCPTATTSGPGTPTGGGVNGPGGAGPGGGPCVPGPMTGVCKPGMGIYGQGGDCPFPDMSLNPLDYFGWMGCLLASIPTWLGNMVQWVVNAVVDLFMPSPEFMERLAGIPDLFGSHAPLLWFADLTGSIESSLDGSGAPSLPTIDFETPGVGTYHFSFAPVMATLTAAVSPYRSILSAATYMLMIAYVFNLVVSVVWSRSQPKQLDLGL